MSSGALSVEGALALLQMKTEMAARHAQLTGASLDITYRCDLDCEHCYLDEKNLGRELSTAAWLDVLGQLRDMGAQMIAWSGGEVFARPDFLQLIDAAAALGIQSRIKTHAGNIDDVRARALAERNVHNVAVSIYSINASVHDGVTRVPGSLERSLLGIQALQRAGLQPSVTVVAMKANVDELEAIDDFFFGLGVPVKIAVNILPDMSSRTQLDDLALDEEDATRALSVGMRAAARRGAPSLYRASMSLEKDVCVAGRTSLYINPEGEVWPCLTFPMVLGNVRDTALADIWHGSKERKALAAWKNNERSECTSCGASGVCGYCPGEAYRRTGNYKVAPPEFHARARAQLRAHAETEGVQLGEGQLASVPAGPQPMPRRAHFPIRVGPIGGPRR